MKRIWIIISSVLFIACQAFASFKSGADLLIDQVDPNINIGVQVVDLNTGSLLYQRNASRLFIPASNMKLFSDAAALMVLGPDYEFKNQLSVGVTQLKNGVLTGNLYLRLPGDPSFSRANLGALLAVLKSWHINKIIGNVVIDSSHANVDAYAPGAMVTDRIYAYGAPIGPLIIDANRTTVTVNPGEKAGNDSIVEVDGGNNGIVITNQVVTKAKATHCGIDFSMDEENHLTVKGCVGVGQWAVQQKMAIRNPLKYAQELIKNQLIQLGIVLEGNVILGKTPAGSMILATEQSKPIAQLMADTLKPSDNLYADSLFLHAAATLKGVPVNWGDAQTIINQFLQQQTTISLKNAVLRDGSGLSRDDRVTPEQTAGLLQFLYDRFPLSYEYIAALPISGRDGTLQRRFKKPDQQDLVRAKTGTMTGIISLSGYLYTANAHTLAFAIYINRDPETKASVAGRYRYLVDALCTYFLQQQPSNTNWAKVFGRQPRIKYQLSPPQTELQRSRQAKWRHLENVIKQSLRGQAVTVIYRGNELVLQDNQADEGAVLATLKTLQAKYPFAVALASKNKPALNGKPLIMWTDLNSRPSDAKRVWTIREASTVI